MTIKSTVFQLNIIIFITPIFVFLVEFLCFDFCSRMNDTLFSKKRGENVHILPVAFCRLPDCFRFSQAFLLPLQTAFNSPAEDSRHFRGQFLRQLLIYFFFWNRDSKRDQPDSSPNPLIAAFNNRFMVRGKEDFKFRCKLKVFLAQKTRRHLFTPGDLLHQRFRQLLPLFTLDGRHKPGAVQTGNIIVYGTIIFLLNEGVTVCLPPIVPEQVLNRIDKSRFTIPAVPE
ncbi:hypothetical protein CHCC14427_3711 [Bacillus paralicheniformis]|nr:hypothetical protein CHCC14427_3711 [Bacillus paralicheniformis]